MEINKTLQHTNIKLTFTLVLKHVLFYITPTFSKIFQVFKNIRTYILSSALNHFSTWGHSLIHVSEYSLYR